MQHLRVDTLDAAGDQAMVLVLGDCPCCNNPPAGLGQSDLSREGCQKIGGKKIVNRWGERI